MCELKVDKIHSSIENALLQNLPEPKCNILEAESDGLVVEWCPKAMRLAMLG